MLRGHANSSRLGNSSDRVGIGQRARHGLLELVRHSGERHGLSAAGESRTSRGRQRARSQEPRHGDGPRRWRILAHDLRRSERNCRLPLPPIRHQPDLDGQRMELEDREVHRRHREGHALVEPWPGAQYEWHSGQSGEYGPAVAQVTGPWVVDLHKGGPLDGKGGGGEQALPFAVIDEPELERRRAVRSVDHVCFGFSTIEAPGDGSAINVNLDASEEADYQYMVKQGPTASTTTGRRPGPATRPAHRLASRSARRRTPTPARARTAARTMAERLTRADAGRRRLRLHQAAADDDVPARLLDADELRQLRQLHGQRAGEPDGPRRADVDEPEQIEQVTVHMDHPFWESFEEDTPVHWDQIAAQYIGVDEPGGAHRRFQGRAVQPIQGQERERHAVARLRADATTRRRATERCRSARSACRRTRAARAPGTIGQDYTTANCPAIRDYYDFIRYTQSTQGHLNSQGLCFIDRQFPAPAGGS